MCIMSFIERENQAPLNSCCGAAVLRRADTLSVNTVKNFYTADHWWKNTHSCDSYSRYMMSSHSKDSTGVILKI